MLLTLPTHSECNRSYEQDEEYFVAALTPSIMDSPTAFARVNEIMGAYRERKNEGLVRKVLTEWDWNPPEIQLKPGQVAKRFDGERVRRIVWKIVRGLHFHHSYRVLPEETPHVIDHRWPEAELPEQYSYIQSQELMGRYKEVLAYQCGIFPELGGMQYWALCFWSRLSFFVAFHGIDCTCHVCVASRISAENSQNG
ncbi:MAG: hypothetical protein HZB26_13250 [Candidatus Hydrogenedentes bacterium]|nr:hypothetical protein [Candidatus Hydrogenedentota bacterium]